jgi:hypothetical protein
MAADITGMLAAVEASLAGRACLILLGGLIACGKGGGKRHDAAVPAAAVLPVRVDGEEVAALTAEQLRARPRLVDVAPDDLPELAEWTHLGAKTADRRELSIRDPAKTHAGLDIVLYLEDGKPAIGLFRTVPAGASPELAAELAKPRVSLAGITEIEVATTPPPTPPAVTIEVVVDGVARTVDLTAIPREAADPEGARRGRGRRPGWPLATVVRGLGASEVEVIGSTELVVDVTDPDVRAVLRRNRRGALALDVWRGGDTPEHKVRDVTRLEIITR